MLLLLLLTRAWGMLFCSPHGAGVFQRRARAAAAGALDAPGAFRSRRMQQHHCAAVCPCESRQCSSLIISACLASQDATTWACKKAAAATRRRLEPRDWRRRSAHHAAFAVCTRPPPATNAAAKQIMQTLTTISTLHIGVSSTPNNVHKQLTHPAISLHPFLATHTQQHSR